ncbi:MAG: hypothetical protein KUG75_09620, partial [Pseudomonadales bacterium]|nr:hypothetical protein [Pseudomonadales bacterium]
RDSYNGSEFVEGNQEGYDDNGTIIDGLYETDTNSQFTLSLYEEFARLCPQGQATSLKGGHLLPMEVPQQTAEFLLADEH